MICPRCNGEMIGVARFNVFIDTCGDCGGIWVDKELVEEFFSRICQAGCPTYEKTFRFEPPRPKHGLFNSRKHSPGTDGHTENYDDYDHYRPRKRSIWDIFD